MNLPIRIGMDTSKSVFQLHGVDENEVVVVRRQARIVWRLMISGGVYNRPVAAMPI
jgi:hypothetical protein